MTKYFIKHGKTHINLLILHEDNYILDPITGCFLWRWSLNKYGYAVSRHDGKIQRVARIIMEPGVGEEVRHSSFCDLSCINPEHLKIGTTTDNKRDTAVDGNQGSQKLTVDDVRVIKQRLENGDRNINIAADYGVTPQNISAIKTGKTWWWIDTHER